MYKAALTPSQVSPQASLPPRFTPQLRIPALPFSCATQIQYSAMPSASPLRVKASYSPLRGTSQLHIPASPLSYAIRIKHLGASKLHHPYMFSAASNSQPDHGKEDAISKSRFAFCTLPPLSVIHQSHPILRQFHVTTASSVRACTKAVKKSLFMQLFHAAEAGGPLGYFVI